MANVKISELPAAAALTGAEQVPVVQGGITSQTTIATLNVFPTATAAAIASIGNAINTANKVQGRAVLDTTNHRLMIADGATAGALWWVADGAASVTPV